MTSSQYPAGITVSDSLSVSCLLSHTLCFFGYTETEHIVYHVYNNYITSAKTWGWYVLSYLIAFRCVTTELPALHLSLCFSVIINAVHSLLFILLSGLEFKHHHPILPLLFSFSKWHCTFPWNRSNPLSFKTLHVLQLQCIMVYWEYCPWRNQYLCLLYNGFLPGWLLSSTVLLCFRVHNKTLWFWCN